MSDSAATLVLMYLVVPLWFAAGVGDWWCHRRTRIESTAGTTESLLHLAMFMEVGMPVLAALVLQIDALLFAVFIAAFLAHEWTAWLDIRYASLRREVSAVEQQIHSFLELLPLTAIILLGLAHPRELLALFGIDASPADFRLDLKQPPLPAGYLVAVGVGIVLFVIAPYAEELWRCLRYSHRRRGRG